jgi:photosystem II stability/assembly factor-like uncharacterized protein
MMFVAIVAMLSAACARHAAPPAPWQAIVVPTDATFEGVWFSDSLNGWLTGGGWDIDGGITGRTRDGGRSWSFQSGITHGGADAGLGHVQFRDSLHGCAAASKGRAFITDDGGDNWRPARGPYDGGLFALQFIDARNGWAVGPGSLARTEDGGETWQLLVRSEYDNGYLSGSAIRFINPQRGWMAGLNATFARTDDGGSTWQRVPLPLREGEHPSLRDVFFVDGRRGWVVGELGSIFHTDDGGATWSRQENGVPVVRVIPKGEHRTREVVPELETEPDRLALMAIRFVDASRGWTVGFYSDVAESVVLGTHDGGDTWSVEHTQKGELLRTLFALDADHAWAAGDRARTTPQVVLRYAGGTP